MWNSLRHVALPFCLHATKLLPNMFPNKNIYIYINNISIYVCMFAGRSPPTSFFYPGKGLQGGTPANMQTLQTWGHGRHNLKAITSVLPSTGLASRWALLVADDDPRTPPVHPPCWSNPKRRYGVVCRTGSWGSFCATNRTRVKLLNA
jgi:hypothetical protein